MITESPMITNSHALPITPKSIEKTQDKINIIKKLSELLTHVALTPIDLAAALPEGFVLDDNPDFALRVPKAFVEKMQRGAAKDPLLWQILPLKPQQEAPTSISFYKSFIKDPLMEQSQSQTGFLQKYAERVLLLTTGTCSIHCRYCFRQHYPYREHALHKHWPTVLAELRARRPMEIILSGGDPLTLSNQRLKQLTDSLKTIDSIEILRIHSREPIVNPERLDAAFLDWLKDLPWPVVVVVHCNHPQELDDFTGEKLQKLRQVAQVLNQSVLLRGINNDVEILATLSKKLFRYSVLPYYLHHLDKVPAATPFWLDKKSGYALWQTLQQRLPGYLLPRYVEEIPGEMSKTLIVEV
jgi:EF-P beta-lysylation protein EpmB